jgi:hypothetical protein
MGRGRGRCGSTRRVGRDGSRRSLSARRGVREAGPVRAEVRFFGANRGPGAFGELRGQPGGPGTGPSRTPTTGGFVVAGAGAGPGREVPDHWEHAHIATALGDQDLCCVRLDARDRAEQLDGLRVRREHELDPLAQVRHELLQVRQRLRAIRSKSRVPGLATLTRPILRGLRLVHTSRTSWPWQTRNTAVCRPQPGRSQSSNERSGQTRAPRLQAPDAQHRTS